MPLGVSLHRPLPRCLAVLFGSVALLLATGAGTASATPSWLPSVDLSASDQSAERPDVAIDPAGNATAVWARYDGSNTIVQAASRPAGGTWSAAVDLSAAGQNAETPQIAISASGEAVAVWTRTNGTNYVIQASSRPLGGPWSAPVDLSATGQSAFDPQLAVAPNGDAVAVWERFNGTHYIAQAAIRPAGGPWGPVADLSAAGQNAEAPQIAINPDGYATAVWSRKNGTNFIVQAASRPAAGPWAAPDNLSANGQNAHNPQVALDPAGNATTVWQRYDGGDYVVQAASRPAGGAWSAVADLSAAGESAEAPQIALDPHGTATAVWTRTNGSHWIVQTSSRLAGGAWSPASDLSEPGQNANAPGIAVNSAGDAVAVWARNNGSNFAIQAATRPVGGAWRAPVYVVAGGGKPSYSPLVSIDAAGNAVAVWLVDDGSHNVIQAAGYDGAGPQLRDLVIPAAGKKGQPLAFSVAPLDVWSALATTTWSFGDGATATGTSASHAFKKPGIYTVTVTSADALGNASSASGTVKITAAKPPKAKAAKQALVKDGKALIKLSCPGQSACAGKLKIAVKAKPAPKMKPKRIQIGAKRFNLKAGKRATVSVKLTAKGLALVKKAGKSGLKAKLGGSGVKAGPLTLKPAPKRR